MFFVEVLLIINGQGEVEIKRLKKLKLIEITLKMHNCFFLFFVFFVTYYLNRVISNHKIILIFHFESLLIYPFCSHFVFFINGYF